VFSAHFLEKAQAVKRTERHLNSTYSLQINKDESSMTYE
jgi:hypothetical protein